MMFVKDLPNSECQKPFEGEYPLEGILRVSTLELAYVMKISSIVKRKELTSGEALAVSGKPLTNTNNSILFWGTETSRLETHVQIILLYDSQITDITFNRNLEYKC